MEKEPVYFISGLGVDERAFIRIRLPEAFEMKFVRWIEPEPNESFDAYCLRLAGQIDTSRPVILAGLSFGGMTSVNLSRLIRVKKIILLSSIPLSHELPRIYRLMGFFGLHRFIPASWVKKMSWFSCWLFGMHSPEEKKLLNAILADIPEPFLYWATATALNWKNETRPPALFHIHGNKDHILYSSKTQPDQVVEGAGHFMVYTHADDVNRFLATVLPDR
jgi:pimeloyl-ACP methyl ester carboxylesterase